MHVSFRETFGDDMSESATFHNAVADKLSEELPRGARYYALEGGDLAIGPEPGEALTLGGFEFVPTPEMEAALGANPTQADFLNYSYNSQKPIQLKLAKQGFITVNGREIGADRFILGMEHELRLDQGSFVAVPHPFPKPFDIEVVGNGERMTLKVRRLPNESVNVMLYESDRNAPLSIRYTITEPSGNDKASFAHFNISANPDKCKKLAEVISVLRIFKAANDGECTIARMKVGLPETNSWSQAKEQTLQWLVKCRAIEKVLGVNFDPKKITLDNEAAATVAELYFGLVQGLPIKSPLPETSIDIGEQEIPNFKEIAQRGDLLALTFTRPAAYTLFGKDLELQSVGGIFGLQAQEITEDADGSHQLILKSPPGEPSGYISNILLRSADALESYYTERNMNKVMETLQQGKLLDEYLRDENEIPLAKG